MNSLNWLTTQLQQQAAQANANMADLLNQLGPQFDSLQNLVEDIKGKDEEEVKKDIFDIAGKISRIYNNMRELDPSLPELGLPDLNKLMFGLARTGTGTIEKEGAGITVSNKSDSKTKITIDKIQTMS